MAQEDPKETTPVFKSIPKKEEAKPVPVEILCAFADMIGDMEERKQEFDPPPWEEDDDQPLNRFW